MASLGAGITSFSMIQAASDSGNAVGLVFFLFDLLYLDEGLWLVLQGIVSKRAALLRNQQRAADCGLIQAKKRSTTQRREWTAKPV